MSSLTRSIVCALVLAAGIIILALGLGACAHVCPPELAATRYGTVLECVPATQDDNGWPVDGYSCVVLTADGRRDVFVRGCR